MNQIYLIPDINRLNESVEMIEALDGAFEYNDFFNPLVLEDVKIQKKIIETYKKVRTDFSNDTMHGAFLDVTIHSQDPLIRRVSEKRMIQSMDIAKEMGLKGVVFHTGRLYGFRDEIYLDNWKKTNVDFLSNLMNKYPNINIYIENMFDEAADVLQEMAKELSCFDNFGVCFDYAHAKVYGENVEEWFDMLAPYIKHMHINDNDLKEDLHLALGDGKIDWNEYSELVCKYGVESSVLIEVNGIDRQKTSIDYIRKNFESNLFCV